MKPGLEKLGTFSALILGMAMAFGLLGMPTVAEAAVTRECRDTCMDSRHVCKEAAKNAMRGCKESCRAADSRRECRSLCRGEFRGAREVCRDAIHECRDACERPAPPSEPGSGDDDNVGDNGGGFDGEQCVQECRSDLRGCSGDVLSASRECAAACFDGRKEELIACRTSSDRFGCFLDVAREFAGCARGCAYDSHTAGRACLDGFQQCREDCDNGGGGGDPYGSASQAFLEVLPTLLD